MHVFEIVFNVIAEDAIISVDLCNNYCKLRIFSCYFPPEHSTWYLNRSVDLLTGLGDTVQQAYDDGYTVYALGDLNSRTGSQVPVYVQGNELFNTDEFQYDVNVDLPPR